MKIVLLGDLHIGVKGSSDVMMYHQQRFFDFLFEYLKQNNISTIIQLGDIWDNRRQANYKSLDFAYNKLFDRLKSNNINMFGVLGNHDIFYRENLDINSSQLLLREFDNVKIFDQCTTLNFDGLKIDFIPWICAQNKQQCIDYISNTSSKVCVGHFEINDFPVLANSLFQGGMVPEQFTRYSYVFSGHFHSASRKVVNGVNIDYVGTPYQLTWNDAKPFKNNQNWQCNHFVVIDTEDVANYRYVQYNNQFFHYIQYDDVNKSTTDIENLDLSNCYVKVVIVNKSKPLKYNNFISSVFQKQPADVKFIDQQLLNPQTSNKLSAEVKDTSELIKQYVDNTDYTDSDKVLLKNYLIKIYNQCLSESNNL